MRNLIAVFAILILVGCQNPMTPTNTTNTVVAKSEPTTVVTAEPAVTVTPDPVVAVTKINLSLGQTTTKRSARTLADGLGVTASFRSSAIEFYSTNGSMLLTNGSIYKLSDVEDNSVFTPGSVNIVSAGDNSNFSLKNTTYDVVRIDVGNGGFKYTVDGVTVTAINEYVMSSGSNLNWDQDGVKDGVIHWNAGKFTDTENRAGIFGTSIFLVKGLTAPVYVEANQNFYTIDDPITDADELSFSNYVNRSDADQLVKAIIKQNAGTWNETCFNNATVKITNPYSSQGAVGEGAINGALFLPFDGIDVTGDTDGTLTINFVWDIAGAIVADGASYKQTDRVGGVPYNFKVTVQ